MYIRLFSILVVFSMSFSSLSEEAITSPVSLSLCSEGRTGTQPLTEVTTSNRERIKRVANALDIRVTFELLAWNRCMNDAREGKYDGLYALFWTEERDAYFVYPEGSRDGANSVRFGTAHFYFYENKDHPLDLDNLSFGIGAPLGYVVRDDLFKKGMLSPIDYDVAQGLVMVSRKKLDAYLIGESLANPIIERLELGNKIRKVEPAYLKKDLHVAFNPKVFKQNKQLILRFWQALEDAHQQDLRNVPE